MPVIYPLDFKRAGHITDDVMHDVLVKPLPAGCRLTVSPALKYPLLLNSCNLLPDYI